MSAFYQLLCRDIILAIRKKFEFLNPLLFFIIVVSLFPLSVTSDLKVLASFAPGIIWVAALLASLLSLEHLFQADFRDTSLEHLLLSATPLSLLVLAKIIAHWLITGLPLVLISPLLGMMLGLSSEIIYVLVLTLLLGTPVLSLVGAIISALTVGVSNNGVLLALLLLPLYIPVLVFATTAINAASVNMAFSGQLALLAALLILTMLLAPFATASALRISTE